jgi:beta-phosphoglucomutase-like phosphatase (HAD superfamily)
MAGKTKPVARERKPAGGAPCAVLFELENVTAGGRGIVYETVKRVLGEKGIEVTHSVFVRHCLELPPAGFLPRLLAIRKKDNISRSKLLAEIAGGISQSFHDGNQKLDKGLAKLIHDAFAHGFRVGCLSGLSEDVAGPLAERLGLPALGVRLMVHGDNHKRFPSPDDWLKLAKSAGVQPTRCVALVTSAVATRSAMAAGMRVLALPDSFTAFEDFSGADFVCDSPGDVPVGDIAVLLGC